MQMIHQLFCSCSPHLSESIPSLELGSDVATLVFYSCFLQKHECVLSVIIPASRFQLGAKPWNRRARMQLNREMRGRKQAIDFDVCKRNLLLKLSKELDKSKKGSVDEPIVDLVEYVNKTPDYCTTSSCSGRFSIFCAAYDETKSAQVSVPSPPSVHK